jgi:hypothetical protein
MQPLVRNAYLRDCTTAETASLTVAFSGTGASTSYAMDGSAPITETPPSTATFAGSSVSFIDEGGHGFSVASGGGSFYGGGFSGSGASPSTPRCGRWRRR